MRIGESYFRTLAGRGANDSLGENLSIAYEARLATDTLRVRDQTAGPRLTAEERQNTALLLLDPLDRLARAKRRSRIKRLALDRVRLLAGELAAIKVAYQTRAPTPQRSSFSSLRLLVACCAWMGRRLAR